MNPTLQQLKSKLIVSSQAEEGEPLYNPHMLVAMASSAINGGAGGLRLAGAECIKLARKKHPDVPIIGITKPSKIPENYKGLVYITPTFEEVQTLAEAGVSIVALDGTQRERPGGETLENIIKKTKSRYPDLAVMADCSTEEDAALAAGYGADCVATTLSGYTTETENRNNGQPDFELLKALVKTLDIPVIMEGRLWQPEQVKQAFDLGAHAMVVGSAITRPQLITQKFVETL